MVEIQCPHCEKDVELEDRVVGLFDCPHCNNEFEFEDDSTTIGISYRPKIGVIILLVFSLLFAIGAGLANSSINDPDTLVKWDELYQYCLTLSGVIFLFAILRYAFQQSIRLVEFNRGKTE
ncbi:MAG: hypothetical protein HN696_00120 [Euryarchaeota archaeon]|jgi:hypothetical protein|nr:hypothetical protein [Euryarchaeota archaeon]